MSYSTFDNLIHNLEDAKEFTKDIDSAIEPYIYPATAERLSTEEYWKLREIYVENARLSSCIHYVQRGLEEEREKQNTGIRGFINRILK